MPAFTVSRTAQIKSDPETVFAILSDFATWKTWSPWLLTDKDAKVTLQGDPTAVGGGYSWDGPVVGAGEMEHEDLHRPTAAQSIGTMHAQLRFTRPWRSQSKIHFEVKKSRDEDGQEVTRVRWEMQGSLPFLMFWMKSMMVNVLSMDFDRGLRMLKELIETGDVASQTAVNGIAQSPPYVIVGKSGRSTLADFSAMHVTHTGRYEHLGNAWAAAYQNLRACKRKVNKKLPGVELYANSPENTPPEALVTQLYVPLK